MLQDLLVELQSTVCNGRLNNVNVVHKQYVRCRNLIMLLTAVVGTEDITN